MFSRTGEIYQEQHLLNKICEEKLSRKLQFALLCIHLSVVTEALPRVMWEVLEFTQRAPVMGVIAQLDYTIYSVM